MGLIKGHTSGLDYSSYNGCLPYNRFLGNTLEPKYIPCPYMNPLGTIIWGSRA